MKLPKRIRNHVNPLSITEKVKVAKFKNKKNVIIDIGSYRGEFGESLLNKFDEERNFVFFEIRKPYQEYLKKLFIKNENVQILGGDAGRNLRNVIVDLKNNGNNIEKIFINFPDPWFKEKHKKRRLVNEIFLNSIKDILDFNTEIIFQTDQKELFKDTIKDIKKNTWFKIKKFKKPIWGLQTYWEKMKISEKNKIYRMKIKLKVNKGFWDFLKF